MSEKPRLSVSQFVAISNQILENSLSDVVVYGEVGSFKVNQGKWVFFDLKDQESSVGCFMTVYQLSNFPLEDGMKIAVQATPKLTNFGKFSLTIKRFFPLGEGNLKKAYELLKAKLNKEGLFDQSKKRPISREFTQIAVISSTQSAGFADFIKILNERWGGLKIQVAHTQVQGLIAADQIIRAIHYFNQNTTNQVIALIRGGGSKDDLAVFNDENLVRTIASSRIPIITGIGHEIDESLADLAADFMASTPSNVAQFLTRDRQAELRSLNSGITRVSKQILAKINLSKSNIQGLITDSGHKISDLINFELQQLYQRCKNLESLNPETVLRRGYSIITGDIVQDATIKIETSANYLDAKIISISSKPLKT